jgi:hypothetical protein
LVVLIVAATTSATSVVRMPLTRIADLSGQIVVGEIASVRSSWARDPRRIESVVTLREVRVLKGHASADRSLCFTVPGGTVGSWSARVAGAPEFQVGQRWALCLLPTWKSFPTTGVHQGAFQLISTDHGELVVDGRGATVTELDGGGFVVTQSTAHGMRSDAFLDHLRRIAEGSTPRALPPGAPVRIIPEYQSVPLVPAANTPGSGVSCPEGIEKATTTPERSDTETQS